nr:MAG TPA: hypothetical protein [Caudoviricetes sp.]
MSPVFSGAAEVDIKRLPIKLLSFHLLGYKDAYTSTGSSLT